jgi:hypothetical protein
VVVIVKRNATSRGLKQVSVLMFSPEDGFDVQAGFTGDVEKADAELWGRRRWSGLGSRARRQASSPPGGARQFQNSFEGQDHRRPAERIQE